MKTLFCTIILSSIIFPDGSEQTTAYTPPEIVLLGDSTIMNEELNGYGQHTPYKYNFHLNAKTAGHAINLVSWANTNGDTVWLNAGIWDAWLRTPLDDYERDLIELIKEIRKLNMKVIWCRTLEHPQNDVVPYNDVADDVMFNLNVPTFDINSIDEIEISEDGVHMTPESSVLVANKVVEWIEVNIL